MSDILQLRKLDDKAHSLTLQSPEPAGATCSVKNILVKSWKNTFEETHLFS